MRRPSEIWGRRTAAVGLGLIAVAALGAGILIAKDDDKPDGPPVSQESAAEQVKQLSDERLVEPVRDAGEGIAARIPRDWDQKKEGGVINLESGDRCVSISLAAPGRPSEAAGLLDDTIAAVRSEFKGAQVRRNEGQMVGGLTGPGAVIEVKSPDGDRVRVLITVGRGEQKAYLTQVVLRDPACGDSLVDSQLVLNSIRYTK